MIADKEVTGEYELEVTADRGLNVLSISDALLELHGFGESDLFGFGAWEAAVPPEDRAAVEAIIDQLLSGEGWVGRFRTQTKTGQKLILELESEVESTSDGRMLVHGRARDITAQAELEAALHAEEAKLRLLSERIPVVLWSTDRDLRFTWSSGRGLGRLGLGQQDLVGTTLFEYFGTEDEDFAAIASHRRALEGTPSAYEVNWMERQWRCSVEPSRDELGNVSGTIGVAMDVTDTAALEAEALELGRGVAQLAVAADATAGPATSGEDGVIDYGHLHIDIGAHRVTKNGATVGLTPTEFKLLAALVRQPGRVLDRHYLLETVWG